MFKATHSLFKKFGGLFLYIANIIYTDPHSKRVRYFKHNAASDILTTFESINSKSIVFDVGGYQGQWSSDIFSKYQPNLYIFEPVKSFTKNLHSRFKHNKKINIFEYGLGGKTKNEIIYLSKDGSSTIKKNNIPQTIKIFRASDFICKQKLNKIDLMKINIEGGEYELLNNLIETKKISLIRNLLIQFHDYIPDAYQEMTILRNKISLTHKPIFCYDFVWEHWVLKK
jgi:FkbM family methyltransferase